MSGLLPLTVDRIESGDIAVAGETQAPSNFRAWVVVAVTCPSRGPLSVSAVFRRALSAGCGRSARGSSVGAFSYVVGFTETALRGAATCRWWSVAGSSVGRHQHPTPPRPWQP